MKPDEKPKEEVIKIDLNKDGHTSDVTHSSRNCDHKASDFIQKTASEVQCLKCGLGLYMTPEEYKEFVDKAKA